MNVQFDPLQSVSIICCASGFIPASCRTRRSTAQITMGRSSQTAFVAGFLAVAFVLVMEGIRQRRDADV